MRIPLFASALLCAGPALAQPVGDVEAGRGLARELCAGCHAVEPGAADKPGGAPSFARIAAVPGMTATALRVVLQTAPAHRTMPMLTLDADETRDVIAYVLSLRP
jgi:mono/diheme cytochrome c family protein